MADVALLMAARLLAPRGLRSMISPTRTSTKGHPGNWQSFCLIHSLTTFVAGQDRPRLRTCALALFESANTAALMLAPILSETCPAIE
jgi:hypothetical protein